MKPFSESCVQNQTEICSVLKDLLHDKKCVLEIGSGTGQHAVYFAKHLPFLIWQTSDQLVYHSGISQETWPELTIDAIFSANAVHIMSWDNVIDYFEKGSKLLKDKGLFILYGPFNYNGSFTSESNANFDVWLKSRDAKSGVRDFEALDVLANQGNMKLKHDIEMAANNRILCWEKYSL